MVHIIQASLASIAPSLPLAALVSFMLMAGAAQAQEYVETEGILSDEDFYRLVACAAPPDGACQKPLVRWQEERTLRLWVAPLPTAFKGGKAKRAQVATLLALKEISQSGAAINVILTRARKSADISLFFVDEPHGRKISGTGLAWVDGAPQGAATTRMQVNPAKGRILSAVITVSNDLSIRAYESVLLEELTQALGLMTDIKNPAYEGVSVFSQVGNGAKVLSSQDKDALRRHYPPK